MLHRETDTYIPDKFKQKKEDVPILTHPHLNTSRLQKLVSQKGVSVSIFLLFEASGVTKPLRRNGQKGHQHIAQSITRTGEQP